MAQKKVKIAHKIPQSEISQKSEVKNSSKWLPRYHKIKKKENKNLTKYKLSASKIFFRHYRNKKMPHRAQKVSKKMSDWPPNVARLIITSCSTSINPFNPLQFQSTSTQYGWHKKHPNFVQTRLGCFDVTAILSWGWLKLKCT